MKAQLAPLLVLTGSLFASGSGSAALKPEEIEFFESKIRPVLAQDCYECHRTGGKRKAGLALDHRAGLLKGGDSGPAIVAGDPRGSLLMTAIRHERDDLKMPKAGAKLENEIIADFEKWIAMGAPDPREEPASDAEVAKDTDWAAVMERRKSWWSFQPVKDPAPPAGEGHPVDRFVAARLQEAELLPTGAADRLTLLRRLSFALRGLPPTPEESAEFVEDRSPDAYEKVVDRYLAAPQFGERWARHWMDWLRYADSHGSEGDPGIPNSWRYRDYLIRALNADVPYDQLVREHVAGDLLEKPRISDGVNESMFGPAHLRMVFHGFAPTDALDEQVRFTDDQINVVTKGFLGLTVACARCHDHKFDAISQKDYYALYGIFASTKPGMVTVNDAGEEGRKRRARMDALKEEIRAKVADHWLGSLDAVVDRLEKDRGLSEKADNPNDVLHAMHVAGKNEGNAAGAFKAWESKAAELKAHRERKYRHDWDFSPGRGTAHGPTASEHRPAGAFTVAGGRDAVVGAIYPAGVYSHLHSTKDPGVALTPRSLLDGKHQVWARVIGDGNPMIRYSVQNYPRNGTVYPTGRIKGGAWRWQRWNLDYWEGDHIHLEVTTARDQAILADNAERSWFGVREVLIVKRGEPDPPGELLDFVEPMLEAAKTGKPDGGAAAVYGQAMRAAATAWKAGTATDGEAILLEELRAKGVLPNKPGEIPGVQALVEEFRKLEAEIVAPTRAPGVWEADSFDQPLFERGNHKKPLARVPRRFLEAVDARPYQTTGSGRRELAADFLRPDNPFTSRVIVNRIWHHLFGRGIVSTTDNLGRLGEQPSHPELLDYLATKFVKEGWSLKKAIRFLVTSETWKRSSIPTPRARQRDPDNILLSHFRVQRLEAEAIRDSLLAVTGELKDEMYGGPITGGAPRRSVYMRIKRNDLDPFLQAFDAPVPVSTVGRRDVTNVPAQSLTMLNSDFVIGLAERWAGKVEGESKSAKVRRMFERALARPPTPDELDRGLKFVNAMAERRQFVGEERRTIEEELKEAEVKLNELLEEARERVLAVRGGLKDGEKRKPAPAPIARWDFEGDAKDRIGRMDAKLNGGARIADGALVVNGKNFASTARLRQPLQAKTLEAWVQLDNLDQEGGGVITLQTPNGVEFDAIVYAERDPRQWLAGSDRHKRTQSFEGPGEEAARDGPVHVAITYGADGTVTGYRQGKPYGRPYKTDPRSYAAGDAEVLFGCRHDRPTSNRGLHGKILEARLYDRALTADEIAASAVQDANFIAEPNLVAAMSPAERREREDLLARQKTLRTGLESSQKPGRPNNEWADYAHALFNLKEFIYVR